MKKRNEVVAILMPLVITLGLYLLFYSRIECKPSHAGFRLILALGASDRSGYNQAFTTGFYQERLKNRSVYRKQSAPRQ